MEYREPSQAEGIQQHLEEALAEDDIKEKNRHIRESLQLLEASSTSGD